MSLRLTDFSRTLSHHPLLYRTPLIRSAELRSTRVAHVHARFKSQRGPNYRRPPQYNRFSRSQYLYDLWATSPVFRLGLGAAGVGGGIFYYSNLERVPISGRLRFNCFTTKFEESMGEQTYTQLKQEFRGRMLPAYHPDSKMVDRVMQRLIPASGLEDLGWEVIVIDDPEQMNAFVIPGGKVFVFSGILPVCGGEDGLAALLGHEISHQLAHHTGEKMSKSLWITALAFIVAYYLDISGGLPQLSLELILERPGSRKMESEADYIGLLMMAQACYDPRAAVRLWERMAKEDTNAPPQFLSTHPASKNRITRIQEWLPEALEKQSQSQCGNTVSYNDQFKQAFRLVDDFF